MFRRMRHLKPREIQGCQLALDASIPGSLYDATSGGSLVAPDGVVKRWQDQSGNAYHVTEATNGPQRKVATMNGLDTLYFDGASDVLAQSAASQSKFFHVSAGATFAAVAHFGTSSDPGGFYTIADNLGGTQANTGFGAYYDDRAAVPSNNRFTSIVGRSVNPDSVSFTTNNDTVTPNAPMCIVSLLDNSNATASLRQLHSINGGAEFGGNTKNFAASSADPTYALSVGKLNGAALYMLGYISEVNGWSRLLSAGMRKRISNSRQRKWRISG